MLLLNLAIADVFGSAPTKESGWNVFRLSDDQVRAITHADGKMSSAVRALSKVFDGPEMEKAA